MKKIVLGIVMILGIVGCGINCPSKPPKRAILSQNSGYGMRYHFILYEPVEGSPHSPSFKCPKQEYLSSNVYTDDLGRVNRNNLVWISFYNEEIPFDETMKKNTFFTFTKEFVEINGLTGDFQDLNGKYKIETTSPDSWGISIAGN
jgi:hypothetical protein